MLSSELEICLNEAFQKAREARHEFMTVEHLLLSIIETTAGARDPEGLRGRPDPAAQGARRVHRRDDAAPRRTTTARCSRPWASSACCSARSSTCSRAARRKCSVANVLVAIFSEKQSHAAYLLTLQDVSRLDVVNYISHGLAKPGDERESRSEEPPRAKASARARAARALEKYATNLNRLAVEGRIDPLIGRALEVERTIEILCRRRKNNPLYVGEAGVGKTAIVEGLARLIVERQGARGAGRLHDLLARHGLADRRHEVPRRLREAAQGRARGAQEAPRRHPVHRRDPHRDRRGRGLGRRHGRLEPDQAGARERRAALHRLDDLPGVSAASSRRTTRWRGASRRSTSSSRPSPRPSRSCAACRPKLRGAPRHPLRRRRARRRGRARRTPHQRPPPARQGHRRHRRGGRAPRVKPAGEREAGGHASPRSRTSSRAWRASRRRTCRRATATCSRNLERNLKLVIFGQDKAIDDAVGRDQDVALGPRRRSTSRSAPSCSPAPPASARRR